MVDTIIELQLIEKYQRFNSFVLFSCKSTDYLFIFGKSHTHPMDLEPTFHQNARLFYYYEFSASYNTLIHTQYISVYLYIYNY